MAATPEIRRPEVPEIQEKQEEFIVPETLQQSTGVKAVQKNFKAQVSDGKGQPLIQTPPAQVITVAPPANSVTLALWAKSPVNQSISWLGLFWLRILKKAAHFGWQITGKGEGQ